MLRAGHPSWEGSHPIRIIVSKSRGSLTKQKGRSLAFLPLPKTTMKCNQSNR